MKRLEKVRQLIASAETDAEKFYNKGNSAAGTRLRNAMQKLKVLAQEIRAEVIEQRNKAK